MKIGPVKLELYPPMRELGWRGYVPARWWCPGKAIFRLGPALLQIPRRWYPARKDGVRVCNCCRRKVWMEGPPNCWCDDCRLLHCQLTGMLGDAAPAWWLSDLQAMARNHWGTNWGKGAST